MNLQPADRTEGQIALVTVWGFAKPEQIAAAGLFLSSDQARYVTGADFVVDSGFTIA